MTKVTDLLTTDTVIVNPVATLSTLYFIYGFYVLLFIIYLYLFLQHRRRQRDIDSGNGASGNLLYFPGVVALFVVSTCFVVFETQSSVRAGTIFFEAVKSGDTTEFAKYVTNDRLKTADGFIEGFLKIAAIAIADIMLTHRLYVLWDSRMVAIPLFTLILLLSGNVVFHLSSSCSPLQIASTSMIAYGSIDSSDHKKFAVINDGIELDNAFWIGEACLNGIITVLTAGRIWYLSKDIRSTMGSKFRKRYSALAAMIAPDSSGKSGLILPVSIVAFVIIRKVDIPVNPLQIDSLLPLLAAIAPTSILVMVRLQQAFGSDGSGDVEAANINISTIHFEEGNLSSDTSTDTSTAENITNRYKEQA
ncbi:hypothetical protein D9758_010097 [Tetrapyrgos nigripes]|uniref:Uncharacterized protein n=1 Tax=Tetrapyrgos nigripes TaxID=182062 RepID=A0A8H5FRY4_9AGAR|nr:hypothetical protein D9758_010097 [Tetrapyrgos nigripes]